MWRQSLLHISFAPLAWCLLLFISVLTTAVLSGCNRSNEDEPNAPSDHFVGTNEMIVYETDSTEWHVCLIATGKTYEEAVQVSIPAPYRLLSPYSSKNATKSPLCAFLFVLAAILPHEPLNASAGALFAPYAAQPAPLL